MHVALVRSVLTLSFLLLPVCSPISESSLSIGIRSSYRLGACRMIPAVPTTTAIVKIHRNNLSRTIATYFQSSLALVASSLARVCSAMKLTQTQDLCMAGEHLVWSNGGVSEPPVRPPGLGLTQSGDPPATGDSSGDPASWK